MYVKGVLGTVYVCDTFKVHARHQVMHTGNHQFLRYAVLLHSLEIEPVSLSGGTDKRKRKTSRKVVPYGSI